MGCGASQGKADHQRALALINEVPIFKRLSDEDKPELAKSLELCTFNKGQVILKEGEQCKDLYVIEAGEASSTKANAEGKAATLQGGDYFGEAVSASTVTAVSQVRVFKVSLDKLHQLGLSEKVRLANRKALGAGRGHAIVTKPPCPKSDEERKLMEKALRANQNLLTFVDLDNARLGQLIDIAWREDVANGTELIKQGDVNADHLYVVQSGSFDVIVTKKGKNPAVVAQKGEAESFGELALIYLVPRAATVKATAASVVWVIDRLHFKELFMKTTDAVKIKEYEGYLNQIETFAPLTRHEKTALAQELRERQFKQKEAILTQGERGNTFFILFDGSVQVVKDGKEVKTFDMSQGKKQSKSQPSGHAGSGGCAIFGEHSLLDNEPHKTTVKVTSKMARALVCDRESFSVLLGPLQDCLKRNANAVASIAINPRCLKRDPIKKGDLLTIGLLGCGAFGTVELVEHNKTKECYALKQLSKGYVMQQGMQENVMNERDILLLADSPFVVKVYETYNSPQTLYFLLELAIGGEIYANYNKKGLYGSHKHSAFYVAGAVHAFEHLHGKRIIYRDLKPENMLLSEAGWPKVTDMGLAKQIVGKTYTTCGTPDYFAPEVLEQGRGYCFAVDWYTVGILIYELMTSHAPFEDDDVTEIYRNIKKGIQTAPFPETAQGVTKQVILDMCAFAPHDRLCLQPGGVQNFKDHEWYNIDGQHFDWAAFSSFSMKVPYKPKAVKNKIELCSQVDPEDLPPAIDHKDDGSGWDKYFASDTRTLTKKDTE